MPSLTQIHRNLRAYAIAMKRHDSIASQINWFSRELKVSRQHMLVLLGYDPADVARLRGKSLEELATGQPEQALWLSEAFKELVDRFGCDMKVVRAMIHAKPNETGEKSNVSSIPRFRGLKQIDRSSLLLTEIAKGGPQFFERFIDYLRLPLKQKTLGINKRD